MLPAEAVLGELQAAGEQRRGAGSGLMAKVLEAPEAICLQFSFQF